MKCFSVNLPGASIIGCGFLRLFNALCHLAGPFLVKDLKCCLSLGFSFVFPALLAKELSIRCPTFGASCPSIDHPPPGPPCEACLRWGPGLRFPYALREFRPTPLGPSPKTWRPFLPPFLSERGHGTTSLFRLPLLAFHTCGV